MLRPSDALCCLMARCPRLADLGMWTMLRLPHGSHVAGIRSTARALTQRFNSGRPAHGVRPIPMNPIMIVVNRYGMAAALQSKPDVGQVRLTAAMRIKHSNAVIVIKRRHGTPAHSCFEYSAISQKSPKSSNFSTIESQPLTCIINITIR